jgi:hypothetical protein
MPARLARGLGVWWGGAQTSHEFFEGRDPDWERVGRWCHIAVVLPGLAVLGYGAARRRSRVGVALRSLVIPGRLVPFAAVAGIWIVTTMATYGSTRLRAGIDPILAVLAVLGLVALALAARPARGPQSTAEAQPTVEATDGAAST